MTKKNRARSSICPAFLAMLLMMLLGGCATGHALGSATSGFGLHSRSAPLRYDAGPLLPTATAAPVEDTGGAGGFPEPTTATWWTRSPALPSSAWGNSS